MVREGCKRKGKGRRLGRAMAKKFGWRGGLTNKEVIRKKGGKFGQRIER